LRFRSKPVAALSIVLVLVGALGGWHTPDDVDDYALRASHHSTNHDARVAAASRATGPEHCALCHWLQALGKAAPAAPQVLALDSSQLIRASALFERVRTANRLALPSRAPPLA
jgi:hypothetical protein